MELYFNLVNKVNIIVIINQVNDRPPSIKVDRSWEWLVENQHMQVETEWGMLNCRTKCLYEMTNEGPGRNLVRGSEINHKCEEEE